MTDLDNQSAEATVERPEAAVEPETTTPDSPQGNKTAEVNQSSEPKVSNMIPKEVLIEERGQRRSLERKLAELEAKSRLSQYDPNDMEAVMAHPFVQELLIKQAKTELTSYAREKLDAMPTIPEAVKKAILANVRGFVKESTTDIDTAKIDIDEYIDSLAQETQVAAVPKVIPVTPTTAKETASGATPAEIQAILETPVDEWTDEMEKKVVDYKNSQPQR